MIKIQHSMTIRRPVADVFAFLSDVANEPKWQEGVVSASVTSPGPLGVGSEAAETRKFLGRDMISKYKITAYEPNKALAFKVTEGPVPFEVSETFEADGDDTKVSFTLQGEPGGFFKLAEGMVRKQLETQITGDFERARKLLEN